MNSSLKKRLKLLLDFIPMGRSLLFYLQSGIPVVLISFIAQKIFRLNHRSPFLTNFTSRVLSGDKITIHGDDTMVRNSFLVSGGCYINAGNGLEIGEGTIWSFNVVIITVGHDFWDLSIDPNKGQKVCIGKNSWIGANSTICPNVILGERTIVGANSVVTKSFPEGNVVIAGCPARVIRKLKLKSDEDGNPVCAE